MKLRLPPFLRSPRVKLTLAFLLHSPFLVLYSFVWVPIFIMMCLAEEKDLLIRYGEAYAEYQKHTGFLFPKKG